MRALRARLLPIGVTIRGIRLLFRALHRLLFLWEQVGLLKIINDWLFGWPVWAHALRVTATVKALLFVSLPRVIAWVNYFLSMFFWLALVINYVNCIHLVFYNLYFLEILRHLIHSLHHGVFIQALSFDWWRVVWVKVIFVLEFGKWVDGV